MSFCVGKVLISLSIFPGSPIKHSTPRFTATRPKPRDISVWPAAVKHGNDTGSEDCPHISKGNLLATSDALTIPMLPNLTLLPKS